MAPPVFKLRNIRVRVPTTSPTFIYGVIPYIDDTMMEQTLANGTDVNSVSAIVLTIQISNVTGSGTNAPASGTVATSVGITSTGSPTFSQADYYSLVSAYPLISQNSFDPLSGNLVLTANNGIWVTSDTADGIEVVASIMEISNASAM